jgi:hypothetical protein
VLDVDAFLARAEAEIDDEDYQKAVDKLTGATPGFLDAQAARIGEYRAEREAAYLAQGVPVERARRLAGVVGDGLVRAVKGDTIGMPPIYLLTAEDVVVTDEGKEIRVGDIMLDPPSYFGQAIADPHEGPDYGRATAVIFEDRMQRGCAWIWSHAHGGCIYHLVAGEVLDGAEDFDASVPLAYNDFRCFLPKMRFWHLPSSTLWVKDTVSVLLPSIKTAGGKKISPIAWLAHNRPITAFTWAPGHPALIRNQVMHEGELAPSPGTVLFNTYLPPQPCHGDPKKAGPWIDHLRRLYGDETAKHILAWMAWRVQHPEVKINHCLVLGGAPGIGKDTALAPLMRAVGAYNVAEVSPTTITGKFNTHMRSVVMRISEVRNFGETGMNVFKFHEAMKTVLASPPLTHLINGKHMPEYHIPNIVGVVMTTNYQTSGLYLPSDDRRHYVCTTQLTASDLPADYFVGFWHWLRTGGIEHATAYLMTLDISGFDPKQTPPKTAGFWAMVQNSSPPEDVELQSAIVMLRDMHGAKFCAFTLGMIREVAEPDLRAYLADKRHRPHLSDKIDRLGYPAFPNVTAEDRLWPMPVKRGASFGSTLPSGKKFERVRIYVQKDTPVKVALEAIRRLQNGG